MIIAVLHKRKVTHGVMMKTTIVDVDGMAEIAVGKMLKKITARNANVLTQTKVKIGLRFMYIV